MVALAVAFSLAASPGAHARSVTQEGWRAVLRHFVGSTIGSWLPGSRARVESPGARGQNKGGFLIDPNGNPVPSLGSGESGADAAPPSVDAGGQA
jgi:hypothetical protein